MVNSIVPFSDDSANEPLIFKFKGTDVPVQKINGIAWWYAAPVCKALELDNVSRAVSRLDPDEQTIVTSSNNGIPVRHLLINQSGLYSLILTSRKEEAKEFKRWIVREVLPAIINTGSYTIQPMTMGEMLVANAQAFLALERKTAELQRHVTEHDHMLGDQAIEIETIKEKVDRADWVTITSWCATHKIHVEWSVQSKWGKAAVELSRQRGIEVFEVETPTEKYPHVNVYHKSVLQDVCVAKPKLSNQPPLLPPWITK